MSGLRYNIVRAILLLSVALCSQEVIAEEQTGQQNVSQEDVSQSHIGQERGAQDKAGERNSALETAAQEKNAQEAPPKESARKKTGEEKATEEKTGQDGVSQEKPAEETAAREKPGHEDASQQKTGHEKRSPENPGQVKASQDNTVLDKAAPLKPRYDRAAQEKAGQQQAAQQKTAQQNAAQEKSLCDASYTCIGMTIDSGDPVLIQMGQEMSALVTDKQAGTAVKPTAGPIENVAKLLSRENAGLTVVPSDMLHYIEQADDLRLKSAKDHLRFIMTIGKKVVHVIARNDIARLEDLQGKRVVVGPNTTAVWVVSNNILNLRGIEPSTRIQLKPPEAIKAVLSGEADAAFLVGDPPMQKLVAMRENADLRPQVDQVHMLELKLPLGDTGYQSATVNYPGFAENLETVAILPTLVSYNFAEKSTPYFRRRCGELARIGQVMRSRLEQLRASGHKQWNSTSWEMDAGNWQKDTCFFNAAEPLIARGPRGAPAKRPVPATQVKSSAAATPAEKPAPTPAPSSPAATTPVARQTPSVDKGSFAAPQVANSTPRAEPAKTPAPSSSAKSSAVATSADKPASSTPVQSSAMATVPPGKQAPSNEKGRTAP